MVGPRDDGYVAHGGSVDLSEVPRSDPLSACQQEPDNLRSGRCRYLDWHKPRQRRIL
jgi:hypothetical protein